MLECDKDKLIVDDDFVDDSFQDTSNTDKLENEVFKISEPTDYLNNPIKSNSEEDKLDVIIDLMKKSKGENLDEDPYEQEFNDSLDDIVELDDFS